MNRSVSVFAMRCIGLLASPHGTLQPTKAEEPIVATPHLA